MQKKPSHVKHYLRAKTPELLKKKMELNNVEKMHYFDYQIIFDGQNWFAWYEWDVDTLFASKEMNEDESN